MSAIPVRCQWCKPQTTTRGETIPPPKLGEQVGHQLVVAVKGRPPVTYCHGQACLTCPECFKVTVWEGDALNAPTSRQMEAPAR